MMMMIRLQILQWLMLIIQYFHDFNFDLALQTSILIFNFGSVTLADRFSSINLVLTFNSTILRFHSLITP